MEQSVVVTGSKYRPRTSVSVPPTELNLTIKNSSNEKVTARQLRQRQADQSHVNVNTMASLVFLRGPPTWLCR